jgi:hypothetical protein
MRTVRIKVAAVALALAAGSTLAVVSPPAPEVAAWSTKCFEWDFFHFTCKF